MLQYFNIHIRLPKIPMSHEQLKQNYQEHIKLLVSRIAQKKNHKKTHNYLRTNEHHHNLTYHQTKKYGTQYQQQIHSQNKKNKKIKFDDLSSLDVSDMLKTVNHQKKVLHFRRREELQKIHMENPLTQDDYKYFMMIASQANYRKLEYPGYYKQLLEVSTTYPQIFFVCINKDIPRTMPDDHPLQKSLKNVLYAYAIRNPSLLYCQGMNYLVGFLLINKFNEEEAFWMMVQLIQDIVMTDYFKDLSTISLTVQLFQEVMSQVFPELATEMQEVGMQSGIFLVGWFICLFTKGFINSVSQFILQEIILQSYEYPIGFTLIKIALSILATLFTRQQRFEFQEKDFKSLKESIQGNVYQISLQQLKKGMNYFDFDFEAYSILMDIYKKKRQKIFTKVLEKQLNQKKLSLPHCNIDQPVCIHRVEIQKKIGTVQQVLILKNNIPIIDQFIQNYFPTNVSRSQPKISYESPNQCPITHHTHICGMSSHKNLIPKKKFAQQSQKYDPQHDGQISIEVQSRFSKIQDRFSQFSSYFIIDQNSSFDKSGQQEVMQLSIDSKSQDKNQQDQSPKNHTNFVVSVGNVFRKALDSIKLFKSGLQYTTNQTKISQFSP